ncbi:hypothetical protein OROMI_010959 [Orobanche minor]
MLGTGAQFNRSINGDDGFYSAVKAHRSPNFMRSAQRDISSWRSRLYELMQEKSMPESPAPAAKSSSLCNLERFLESVAPSVQAQYLSKMTEWSAYGIQLYADLSKSKAKLRNIRLGEESDCESFRDSFSDGSSDSKLDRGISNYSGDKSVGVGPLQSRDEGFFK